ncbi:carbohydrate ABC transporter permease [Bianquea renquensis]|uniref:Carbohydrate ABC transporter permease n=1 Tax=Bianquea renquensis TaxID=2763661 RepID=A0A926DS69_9FIRM|nr:carbohydrate ABC transporter permease [Bianquea renquensis]MBC8542812.1 carbohydrate ABC transporter permease [Bianquea renquensis]
MRKRVTVGGVINGFLLVLIAAVMLFPYLNVMATAFNDGADAALGGITIYPRVFTLENFKVILKDSKVIRATMISVCSVVVGTLFGLFVQFTAAYAFSKKSFPGKKLITVYLMIPMYISGGLIPSFILYSTLKMLNTFWMYVLPGMFNFYNMIMMRTYIKTIPDSLQEAAKIDGASEFTILWRIILPLSAPILATVSLWLAVGYWNDWTTPLYYIRSTRLQNLQYLLMRVLKESEMMTRMLADAIVSGNLNNLKVTVTPEAVKAAQVVITTIPIILIYPFLQKYFIKGVMIGAIKE